MSDQNPHTPSLDEVRDDYVIENMRGYDEFQAGEPAAARRARYRLRFDRLIAQVRAEAWKVGVATALNHAKRQSDGITLKLETFEGEPWPNPYREGQ